MVCYSLGWQNLTETIGHIIIQKIPVYLVDNWLRSIAVDNSNNIWIGGEEEGLFYFDGNNFTVYDTTNSELPHNTVRALAVECQYYLDWNIWRRFGKI